MSLRPLLLLLLPLSIVCAAAACGDDDGPTASASDAGADAEPEASGPVVVGESEVKQTGKIVRARATDVVVEGATVSIADKTATTNASGDYEIAVPKGTPTQMKVSAPEFFTLIEQEWIVNADISRGESQLLPTGLAGLLAGVLNPPRDEAKGLLVVSVRPQPPCASEEGATLTIDPPGQAKLAYIGGGLPDNSRSDVKAGESFSAIFYDVDPGVTVRVSATSPTCEQVPFPVETDGVTYTGNQKTEPGEALAFLRVYLGPAKIADAGTD
jgi:hypothetical protein